MANSDDLSAGATASTPPRRQVRLTGPSVALDEGSYAVRRDLAEIAVANRIFAQHYVEPMRARVNARTTVHVRPAIESETVATLVTGDVFNLIDLGREWAWGRGDAKGTVGYVATSALDLP